MKASGLVKGKYGGTPTGFNVFGDMSAKGGGGSKKKKKSKRKGKPGY